MHKIICRPRPVQKTTNNRNVVFVTTTPHNVRYEGLFKIVFRTNRNVNTNKNRTRNKRRSNARKSKAIERHQYYNRKKTQRIYSGTLTKFYCTATNEVREGSIHCLGKDCMYEWKLSVLKPQCDIFFNTDELLLIADQDGSSRKPWYKIFLGEVSYTDLIYQDDPEAIELQNKMNM